MLKKKTSKKHGFSFDDIQPVKLKKGAPVTPYSPSERLRNKQYVADALMECLRDGDAEAFKEILAAHLQAINKAEFAERTKIPKRTLFRMVSKQGNPTLDNIAKVVHALTA
jgi:probable addiction module antidote protein